MNWFSQTMQEMREDEQITTYEVAKRLGKDKKTLYRIESGKGHFHLKVFFEYLNLFEKRMYLYKVEDPEKVRYVDTPQAILNFVKRVRKERGISYKDMGDYLGCSSTCYKRIEQGITALTTKNVERILDYIGYNIALKDTGH